MSATALISRSVVLISKATAQKLFPGEDPIGRQMYFGTDNDIGLRAEVVGIVGDVRFVGLDRTARWNSTVPGRSARFPFFALAVKSQFKPEARGQWSAPR